MRNIFKLFVILAIIGLGSCKKSPLDSALCSGLWTLQVADEALAMSEASNAYSEDPSEENCIAYRNACQDYVDALEPFKNCKSLTADERKQIQDDIDETEAEIDTLCEE